MRSVSLEPRWSESRQALATVLDFVGREAEAASQVTLLSLPCSHVLDHILPIFPPKITVFCAFSPPGRDGSNEPQAETQGQETAARGPRGENSALRSTRQMPTKGSTGVREHAAQRGTPSALQAIVRTQRRLSKTNTEPALPSTRISVGRGRVYRGSWLLGLPAARCEPGIMCLQQRTLFGLAIERDKSRKCHFFTSRRSVP